MALSKPLGKEDESGFPLWRESVSELFERSRLVTCQSSRFLTAVYKSLSNNLKFLK